MKVENAKGNMSRPSEGGQGSQDAIYGSYGGNRVEGTKFDQELALIHKSFLLEKYARGTPAGFLLAILGLTAS